MIPTYKHALIIGAGSGLSASIARLFAAKGLSVSLAARRPEKLAGLCEEIGAKAYGCEADDPASMAALFEAVEAGSGAPDVAVYNPSARVKGPVAELDPTEVDRTLRITAYGGFLMAREAARRMVPAGHGAILFTGASASVKGYPLSAPFAMGKFALRGLAQSIARELQPQGVHVGHVVIDGGIREPGGRKEETPDAPDKWLDPDAIARAYWGFLEQDRSAWSWEIELRPWVEKF